jgi:hypothetical protein
MPLGALLTLDAETTTAVRQLWQAVDDAGLHSGMTEAGYPPHITLFMGESGDAAGLKDALQRLARATPPRALAFLALGVFPAEYGVIFLAPVANRALLELHESAWQAALPYLEKPMQHYRPGVWVPHVTLSMRLPQGRLGLAADLLARAPWPRSGSARGFLHGDFRVEGESFLEEVELTGK